MNRIVLSLILIVNTSSVFAEYSIQKSQQELFQSRHSLLSQLSHLVSDL